MCRCVCCIHSIGFRFGQSHHSMYDIAAINDVPAIIPSLSIAQQPYADVCHLLASYTTISSRSNNFFVRYLCVYWNCHQTEIYTVQLRQGNGIDRVFRNTGKIKVLLGFFFGFEKKNSKKASHFLLINRIDAFLFSKMHFQVISLVICAVLSAAVAEVYFEEKFLDGTYTHFKADFYCRTSRI